MNIFKHILTIIIIFSSNLLWAENLQKSYPDGNLLFVGDFETGGFSGFTDTKGRWEHTKKKIRLVNDPVRFGWYAVEFTLDRKNTKDINYRTDMVPAAGIEEYLRTDIGQEYWYGFSVFLPKDWVPDTQSELFAQWHGSYDKGEEKRSPVLAIYVYGEDYYIKKRWDKKAMSEKKEIPHEKLWGAKIAPDKAKWVDWVFHVKWSFNEDGFIEVWKGGGKIVSDKGPNCYNDDKGPYFRFGPYKWPWKDDDEVVSVVDKRIIYFDEIRIGDKNANFTLVSPPEY